MTSPNEKENKACPAESLLKMLAGKWKPQLFKLAMEGPLRFNSLLRSLEGSNKQSLATALKELESEGLLERKIIRLKPLHVEYHLSAKGNLFIPVMQQLEQLSSSSPS